MYCAWILIDQKAMFYKSLKQTNVRFIVSRMFNLYHKAFKEALIVVSYCIILSLNPQRIEFAQTLEDFRQRSPAAASVFF